MLERSREFADSKINEPFKRSRSHKNMSGLLTNIEIWLQRIFHYNLEVISLVAGSNNKTFSDLNTIVDSNHYKKVKILKKNFGSSDDVENFGFARASGDCVAFWDSDDIPDVDASVNMINTAQKARKQIAVVGLKKVNSNLEKSTIMFKIRNDFNLSYFFKTVRNPRIWYRAFKKPIMDGVFLPNSFIGEDQIFLANLNIHWLKGFRGKENVYDYKQGNPSQLTTSRLAINDRLKLSQYLFKTQINDKHFSFFTRNLKIKIKSRLLINRIMS